MDDKNLVAVTGLICITGLSAIALVRGINGVMFTGVIGAVSGIVGLAFGFKLGVSQETTKVKKV